MSSVRDFAPPPPKPRRAWMMVAATGGAIVLLAAAFAIGFKLGERHGVEVAAGEERKRLEALLNAQREENARLKKALAKQKKIAHASAYGEDRLMFYYELPNEPAGPAPKPEPRPEATPTSPESAPAEPQAAQPTAPDPIAKLIASNLVGHWFVQAGSFRRREDADKLAARLKAEGFAVEIVAARIPDKGLWYRVQAGPYPTQQEAERARHLLHERLKVRGFVLRR
ncbi:MAG: hypothetical protein D6771_07320 [Zetaproteobacteria bacterium]|nr:MAG: hypothetical protein D6771_07320 [Zetaproteobacteria bacterium]